MGPGSTSKTTMGRTLVRPALIVALSLGLAGCTYTGAPDQTEPAAVKTTPSAVAPSTVKPALSGETVRDSFGNADFYTLVTGDTLSAVAAAYKLSEAKLAGFNGLQPGAPLTPGTRLRLIPDGPMPGAMGAATVDANGIPTSYTIEPEDSLAGITYRFNLTDEQLAEANKVAFTYEKGNVYFIRAGNHIQLQKNPVDSRSGQGTSVNNSFGQTIFYTTVDGDSFDSLGYKFRCTTDQLLRWNTALTSDQPIPAGTKVRLMPGDVTIEGSQGTFTTDADGIPLTYTTAPGDTERQVAFRFGVPEIADLSAANRDLAVTGRVWYSFSDVSVGELTPGQTISLNLAKPIHQ